jgi:hypothetical protein
VGPRDRAAADDDDDLLQLLGLGERLERRVEALDAVHQVRQVVPVRVIDNFLDLLRVEHVRFSYGSVVRDMCVDQGIRCVVPTHQHTTSSWTRHFNRLQVSISRRVSLQKSSTARHVTAREFYEEFSAGSRESSGTAKIVVRSRQG